MKRTQITGLVAAAHTPFHTDGSLKLSVVERQAEHYANVDLPVLLLWGE